VLVVDETVVEDAFEEGYAFLDVVGLKLCDCLRVEGVQLLSAIAQVLDHLVSQ
jgi:hypothetical protein